MSTELLAAAKNGNTEAVKNLLEKKADVNVKDKFGDTALIHATERRHKEIIRMLLNKGADPNIRNKYGNTALMIATESNYIESTGIEIIRMLLNKGADPNLQDNDGNTALIEAGSNGQVKFVHMFLDKGADPNVRNKNGDTALMLASFNGGKKMVRMLLNKGADPDIKDEDGKTALMLASFNGNKEMVRMLLNKGADPDIKDKDGKTALMYASELKIVDMIKKHQMLKGTRKRATPSRTKSEPIFKHARKVYSLTDDDDIILGEKVPKRDTVTIKTDGKDWAFDAVALARWVEKNPTNPMTRARLSDNQKSKIELKAVEVLKRKPNISLDKLKLLDRRSLSRSPKKPSLRRHRSTTLTTPGKK